MRISLATLALVATTVAAAAPASAGVIFDSRALGEPICASGGYCLTETRGSQTNYAAVLQFSADVTVTSIGIYSSVPDAQDIEFLIFDSALSGGSGNLLFSQVKSYGVTAQQFLYTDPMSFTFQAGHTYDVGILGDGNQLTGRWIAYQNLSQGPVTEIARNANFSSYASPSTGGYAGVSPWVQLVTAGGTVPEPATWALMIGGFGLVGLAARRRAPLAV